MAERASDLPDEVLERVEARQRAAIKAMRNFVDRLDDAIPDLVDDPSVRKEVVDAIGDYYEQLATTTNEFLRRVVRFESGMVTKPGDAAKDLYKFLRSFVRSASETVTERASDLPDEVLERVEATQRTAIKAMRNFVDRLDDAMPNLVDDPSVRKEVVVDAIGDYYEQLATTTNEFYRRVVRFESGMVTKPGDAAKDLYKFVRSFVRSASETVSEQDDAKPAATGAAKKAAKGAAKKAD